MLTQILINGKDMNLSEYPEVEERLIFLSPEELQEIKRIVSNKFKQNIVNIPKFNNNY